MEKNCVLKPIVAPLIKDFLQNQERDIFKLIEDYHSPLNIVFPQIAIENVAGYDSVFKKNKMNSNIYFALKANKSMSLLRVFNDKGVGVEVSSLGELRKAIDCGFSPTIIIVTGPSKTDEELFAAADLGAIISVDDQSELAILDERNKKIHSLNRTRIIFRVNIGNSRFGLKPNEIREIISGKLFKKHYDLLGFSFHINNYSIIDRVRVIKICSDLITESRLKGFEQCKYVDIG